MRVPGVFIEEGMLWYNIIAHFNKENTCQYLAFDRSPVNNISIHMAAIKCKVLACVLDIRYQMRILYFTAYLFFSSEALEKQYLWRHDGAHMIVSLAIT